MQLLWPAKPVDHYGPHHGGAGRIRVHQTEANPVSLPDPAAPCYLGTTSSDAYSVAARKASMSAAISSGYSPLMAWEASG
jgi:alkanesulfonate monooxygenase SsuD/methylene tetrahydromethanopterin reductase-like flavin-dependent oxidoreductase (luciferase family)